MGTRDVQEDVSGFHSIAIRCPSDNLVDTRKSSIRCLMGFLVDLTLTMDILFYLVLAGGQKPMKIGLVNRALRIYKIRKAPVHASIRAWADGWSVFGHLDANDVIDKITDIIEEHSVKPEQWEMRDEVVDEFWMAVDALRETEMVRE